MSFTQFVEIGRLCLISYGPLADELALIVDIIDDKRVLIDVLRRKDQTRQVIPVKRIRLTDFHVKIERGAPAADVEKAVADEKLIAKFEATKWAKRLAAQKAKLEMNDFQRFKYAKLAAKRDELVKAELAK